MCKNPINYADTVIYKICSRDPAISQVYIGSTTNLKARRGEHKRNCNNPKQTRYNTPVYAFIRANGNWEMWDVVLIEEYFECTGSEDAKRRERYWFEYYAAALNSCVPLLTADERLTYAAAYYVKNKPDIAARKAKLYVENREENLERAAKYRAKLNKQDVAEAQAAYYVKNRARIAEEKSARYQAKKQANN